ncbi:MAG: hypothetical protein HY438_02110 [DPANN group archaeon]|nr:hypothetical protein [DPANN group archaeon]
MTDAPVTPNNVLSKLNDLASKKKQLEQQQDTILRAKDTYAQMRRQYLSELEQVRAGMASYPNLLGLLEQLDAPELQGLEERVSPSPYQINAKKIIGPCVLQAIDEVPGGLTIQQIFEKLGSRFTQEEVTNAINNYRIFLNADEQGKYTVSDRGRASYTRSLERAARRASQPAPTAPLPETSEQPEDVGHVNIRNSVLRMVKQNPNIDMDRVVRELPNFTRSQIHDAEYVLLEAGYLRVDNGRYTLTGAGEERLSKPGHGDMAQRIREKARTETLAVNSSKLAAELGVSGTHVRKVLIEEGWQVAFKKYFVPGSWVRGGAPEKSMLAEAVAAGNSIAKIERHLRQRGIRISTDTVRKYLKMSEIETESQDADKSKLAGRQHDTGMTKAIAELSKDRAISCADLAEEHNLNTNHVRNVLRRAGWKNVFQNIYVYKDMFGEDAGKAMITKAFETGKNIAGAQEFLKSIGIDVHICQIAELASESGLINLEETIKSAAKEIGIDYDSLASLPTANVIMRAMQAFKRNGKEEVTVNDLKLVLPKVHNKRKHYVIFDLIKDNLIEKTGNATYRLTEAGEKFSLTKQKIAGKVPYEISFPVAEASEEAVSAGLHAMLEEGAGLEGVLGALPVESQKTRSIKPPIKLNLSETILYVLQKSDIHLTENYLAQVLSQKYKANDVLSEIEILKARGAIKIGPAGNLVVRKSGLRLLASKFHPKIKESDKEEAGTLASVLEAGTQGLQMSEFDKKVFAGIDSGPMQLMYILYSNDKQENAITTRSQIEEYVAGKKLASAQIELYRLRKNGFIENAGGKNGVYKLTKTGREFMRNIFSERYVHELAGQPLASPKFEAGIAQHLEKNEKAEYAALLLSGEGGSFGYTDVERMFSDLSHVTIKRTFQKLARDGEIEHVKGTHSQYLKLTERGVKALDDKFVKLKEAHTAPASVTATHAVPQLPVAQNVPSLLEGIDITPPPAVKASQQSVSAVPIPVTPLPSAGAEAKPQPSAEKKRAIEDKLMRFWNDHKIPVSETLVGQIMNGDHIENFLGENVKQRKIGGKIVFVPKGVSDITLERWRNFYAIAADAESKGQPVIMEQAAILLRTDTDTIRAMTHGLKKSGLIGDGITLKQSEKIDVRDPETIRNRVSMCLRFGGVHAITTTDLVNMTGLSAVSLLSRSLDLENTVNDLIKKIFSPQDAKKISISLDKGKGGKNPAIIISRKE